MLDIAASATLVPFTIKTKYHSARIARMLSDQTRDGNALAEDTTEDRKKSTMNFK